MQAYDIAASGLNVEWQRFSVIAENLARLNSVVDAAGERVGSRRLISGPDHDFQTIMRSEQSLQPSGVKVFSIAEMDESTRQVHEPDHPLANENGFVTYPKIDHGREMALMLKTMRAYEANLTSISIAQQMYSRALEIGRGQ